MSGLPPLELHCFGVPTARLAGGPAPPEVLRRKHLALLVYLALSPKRRRTRAHLVGVLWPETDDARARHSLNEAIRRLRAHVGEARLASDSDSILLREDALEVDALRYDALLDRSPADAARLVEGWARFRPAGGPRPCRCRPSRGGRFSRGLRPRGRARVRGVGSTGAGPVSRAGGRRAGRRR